jgi:protein-tyrosine phosphatase
MSARGPKVLFVCTGNICRSPFAAAVGRREGLDASSAGTDVVLDCATEDGIAVAGEFGIDLRSHRSRQLTDELRGEADLVVTMRELGGGVDDPYGRGRDAYRAAYAQIERAVVELAEELR